ncbi:MAG TPA: metabolite traffic protein EboE [Kofleriaceae bacterium]|nr:metabolite traffic protein EboE [Kofleriaceae bacterium]
MQLVLADRRTAQLGYCYNVLPGETVAALLEQLHRICGPVRDRLGVARLGVGLWIARPAATELVADAAARRQLRRALEDHGLYCFTLNGFPYGGFHAPRVKHAVFEPTWADAARVDYTIDLATILAELLPDDVATGSISTVPLGPATVDRDATRAGLARAGDAFAAIAARTGKQIELAIEPEPGACFERAAELAAFLGASRGIGVCLDCCHAAVVDEDPARAFAAMAAAGVRCAKIQISSALVARDPARDAAALAALDEPRFLHQVRSARGGAMDIPDALAALDRTTPWRIHFHVPVHRAELAGFTTTRDAIAPVLAAALAAPGPLPHLEVETYTWSVLPAADRASGDAALVDGIARELRWTLDVLAQLGAHPA